MKESEELENNEVSVFDRFERWEASNHWLYVLAVLLLVVWFCNPILVEMIYGVKQNDDAASIGSSYGWSGSLISGVAMFLLLLSLRSQQKAVSIQNQQAIDSRKVSEAQIELARLTAQLQSIPSLIEIRLNNLSREEKIKHLDLFSVTKVFSQKEIIFSVFDEMITRHEESIEQEKRNIENALKTTVHNSIPIYEGRKKNATEERDNWKGMKKSVEDDILALEARYEEQSTLYDQIKNYKVE